MELLNACLDVVDTLFTAIGWVVFWYTWVAPPAATGARPQSLSPPEDLDQFLRSAAAKQAGDSLA